MKKLAILAVAFLLGGCGGNVANSLVQDFNKEKHWCKNPRPQFCILIYKPVCGKPTNKTYSNGCVACQDKNVLYYVDGACK